MEEISARTACKPVDIKQEIEQKLYNIVKKISILRRFPLIYPVINLSIILFIGSNMNFILIAYCSYFAPEIQILVESS